MGKFKFLFLLMIFMCSCNLSNNGNVFKEYTYDDIKEYQIEWNDIFLQQQETYLVYFYSPTCGYCEQIKDDVLNFFFKEKLNMYFVKDSISTVIGNNTDKTIGCSNIKDFFIIGTPTLIHIDNHKIDMNIAGVNKIKDYIS